MSGNELQALQCQVMSFRPKTPKTPTGQKPQKSLTAKNPKNPQKFPAAKKPAKNFRATKNPN